SPSHLPKKISPKHLESHTLHQWVQSWHGEHGISSEEEYKNYLLFKETLDSWNGDDFSSSSNSSTLYCSN
ncbi:MAG: hypothetical protein ACK5L1_12970, partial [Pseudanabaena sp.]